METVHDYAFYGLYNITSLRLLYNNLTEAPKLHSLKETLKLLDFLGNEIFYIPRDYFAGFVKLNFLNLSKNKLTTFPNIEYAALQMSLSSVRIYSNKIKRVNRLRPETKFIALDTLKLTNNSLEAFDIDFLKHFGLLGLHIYLDGNNLTTLGNLDNIAKTSDLILFLGNNPWKCCEDLSWMPTFGIGSNSRISWNMIEDPPPVCAKPDHLRGSNVLTLGRCLSKMHNCHNQNGWYSDDWMLGPMGFRHYFTCILWNNSVGILTLTSHHFFLGPHCFMPKSKWLSLQWRHNECDCVSRHWRLVCLLNRLLRRKLKKTSKLRVTDLCEGIHHWPVNSPYKWSVTRKMVPLDGTIMSKPIMQFNYAYLCPQAWMN